MCIYIYIDIYIQYMYIFIRRTNISIFRLLLHTSYLPSPYLGPMYLIDLHALLITVHDAKIACKAGSECSKLVHLPSVQTSKHGSFNNFKSSHSTLYWALLHVQKDSKTFQCTWICLCVLPTADTVSDISKVFTLWHCRHCHYILLQCKSIATC